MIATPSDNDFWSLLSPLEPELNVSGEVRSVAAEDPRNSNNCGAFDFEKTIDGVRVPGWADGKMWVWYRRPTPILTGDDYVATATYEAVAAGELTF